MKLSSIKSLPLFFLPLFALLFCLASIPQAFAYKGSISFTEAEKAAHFAKIGIVNEVSAQCLDNVWREHVRFFEDHRVSKYFGNRRYIKGEVPGRRSDGEVLHPIRPALRARGLDPSLESQMTSMSCVDLARRCLRMGFEAAGQVRFWEKIDAFNKLNNNIGPAIMLGLQALGWKLVYWNPDPRQNVQWDLDDQERSPNNAKNVWGYHKIRYDSVMGPKRKYYEYYVDDRRTLNGFGTQVPREFLEVPFFVGFAHTGYHVFVGYQGEVIEAHSVRSLFALDNVERNMFNPLGGGAPVSTPSEVYLSGLIAVPPGSL